MPCRRAAMVLLAFTATAGTVVGCAPPATVRPVRLDADALAVPGTPPTGYEAAVRSIAAVMARDLALPLPPEVTLYVYPSRTAYAAGLADAAGMPASRAREIAGYSVGLGQRGRLFIHDGALRDTPRSVWLGILAHELTHVAQYELSGGRRGQSEQWLREGMADWVACQVLERLGAGTFRDERAQAMQAVAMDLPRLRSDAVDLVDLGRPQGWESRHLRSGERLTYRLAFLLTDELIRRHGFDRVMAYFRAFADSDERSRHFETAFGVTLAQFEADALARLRHEAEIAVTPAPPWPVPPADLSSR